MAECLVALVPSVVCISNTSSVPRSVLGAWRIVGNRIRHPHTHQWHAGRCAHCSRDLGSIWSNISVSSTWRVHCQYVDASLRVVWTRVSSRGCVAGVYTPCSGRNVGSRHTTHKACRGDSTCAVCLGLRVLINCVLSRLKVRACTNSIATRLEESPFHVCHVSKLDDGTCATLYAHVCITTHVWKYHA